THAFRSTAEHRLDGRAGGYAVRGLERLLNGRDLEQIWLVGFHPAGDGGVKRVEMFHDESAAGVLTIVANGVEGKHKRVAEFAEMCTEPEGGLDAHVRAGDELG